MGSGVTAAARARTLDRTNVCDVGRFRECPTTRLQTGLISGRFLLDGFDRRTAVVNEHVIAGTTCYRVARAFNSVLGHFETTL